jgi:cell wall-associated NlpC family hydrolase
LFPQLTFADDYAAKQAEAEAALQSLNTLMENIREKSLEYDAAVVEQKEAEEKVEKAQKTIEEKTGEIEKLQSKLGSRMEEMYREGNLSFVDVLLNSATFEEFSSNVFLLDRINANDGQLIEETKNAREELEEAKAEYQEQSDKAAKAAQEALEVKEDLASQISSMRAVYDGLSSEAQTLLASRSEASGSVTVPQSEISNYDEATGNITLSDGTQGTLVGYDSNGNAIVERAYSALGSNYVWGGVGGSSGGYDCSGLVSYALTGKNERLGTTGTFMGWTQVTNPQPGDVCTSDGHCGIYIGNGQMIHAADYGTGVVIGKVQDGMIFVSPN